MSKSYFTIHEYQRILVDSTITQIVPSGSSITLDQNHSSECVLLNATSGSVVTLPQSGQGVSFSFIVTALGNHIINSPSPIYGSLACGITTVGNSLLTAQNRAGISTTNGSAIGDAIQLIGDGTNYYVSGTVSQFNALKFI